MTIWSLTTDTDAGLMTDLYLTEGLAYDGLIRRWLNKDTVSFTDAMKALAKGIPEVGESAISRWFDDHLKSTCSDNRFAVERHDHPWVFASDDVLPEPTESIEHAALTFGSDGKVATDWDAKERAASQHP